MTNIYVKIITKYQVKQDTQERRKDTFNVHWLRSFRTFQLKQNHPNSIVYTF